MKNNNLIYFIPSLLFTLIFLILWELYSNANKTYVLFLPAPTSIVRAFAQNWEVILKHTSQTILETGIGFILSIIIGLGFSILISFSDGIKRTIYPILIISQTFPMIALAPLLLIWFGYGLTPKVIMVVLYCFFPITIAVTDAMSSVNKDYIYLAKSMNASKWQIFSLIRFPFSLPALFSGLKISATYAVTASILGEFIGSYQGLGVYMRSSANYHASSALFASILVVIVLSFLLFSLVIFLEKVFIPWKN